MHQPYKIICDLEELQKFIDILPDEKPDEQYYITLFCRKKYDTSGILKCDKNCLKRTTSKKVDIIQKLRQLEVAFGAYSYNGLSVPQECLAVYITPNPRSFTKASAGLAKALIDRITSGTIKNPHSLAMDVLQTSCGTKKFFDIDIDFLEPARLEEFKTRISSNINLDACTFIQTRGGYHCLVTLDAILDKFKSTWYNGFSSFLMDKVTTMKVSDGLVPIPGTTAGSKIIKMAD